MKMKHGLRALFLLIFDVVMTMALAGIFATIQLWIHAPMWMTVAFLFPAALWVWMRVPLTDVSLVGMCTFFATITAYFFCRETWPLQNQNFMWLADRVMPLCCVGISYAAHRISVRTARLTP